jgi:hypothetical protein
MNNPMNGQHPLPAPGLGKVRYFYQMWGIRACIRLFQYPNSADLTDARLARKLNHIFTKLFFAIMDNDTGTLMDCRLPVENIVRAFQCPACKGAKITATAYGDPLQWSFPAPCQWCSNKGWMTEPERTYYNQHQKENIK